MEDRFTRSLSLRREVLALASEDMTGVWEARLREQYGVEGQEEPPHRDSGAVEGGRSDCQALRFAPR